MQSCIHSGAPTILYDSGRPICLECLELIEAGNPSLKKPPQPSEWVSAGHSRHMPGFFSQGADIRYDRRVECAVCQRLEAELDRLEPIRVLKSQTIQQNWQSVRSSGHGRLRSEESDARLALEVARA